MKNGQKILTISAKAEITLPSVVKLLLIFAPSLRRVPLAPVESARSEPAKSTRLIFDTCKRNTNHKYIFIMHDNRCFTEKSNLFRDQIRHRIMTLLCEKYGENRMRT